MTKEEIKDIFETANDIIIMISGGTIFVNKRANLTFFTSCISILNRGYNYYLYYEKVIGIDLVYYKGKQVPCIFTRGWGD